MVHTFGAFLLGALFVIRPRRYCDVAPRTFLSPRVSVLSSAPPLANGSVTRFAAAATGKV